MEIVAAKECGSYQLEKLTESLRDLLEPLGGMKFFVKPGQKVLVKPNFLAAEPVDSAVTTHPAIITAVINLARECGAATVHVRDNPALTGPEDVARRIGLFESCPGVDVLPFRDYRPVQDKKDEGVPFSFAHEVFDYDVVINLPKLKTHCQMTMTAAVKNWFGLVDLNQRLKLHMQAGCSYDFFADLLLNVCLARVPDLSILDAVIGMEGPGPGGGDPVKLDFIAASRSPFALDDFAVRAVGHRPAVVPTVRRSAERGLIPKYQIVGDPIVRPPLRIPGLRDPGFMSGLPASVQRIIKNVFLVRPRLNPERCIHCRKCMQICPASAITWQPSQSPYFDYLKCIRCFCCIEACPNKALRPYESPLAPLLRPTVACLKVAVKTFKLIRAK